MHKITNLKLLGIFCHFLSRVFKVFLIFFIFNTPVLTNYTLFQLEYLYIRQDAYHWYLIVAIYYLYKKFAYKTRGDSPINPAKVLISDRRIPVRLMQKI